EPLARILAPFAVDTVLAALRGEATLFDVDGEFESSHMGDPRLVSDAPAFDGKAMLAAAQTIAWLSACRPVGDPLRAAIPMFYEKVRARLASPALMLMGGFRTSDNGYVYFRPVRLAPEEHPILAKLVVPAWKSETFPFGSVYGVYRVLTSAPFVRLVQRALTTPLAAGAWEADPRVSAPDVVRAVMDRHVLSEDAATLYLQLLALADCADEDLTASNAWPRARLEQAGTELVARELVVAERKRRSGRNFALPGPWEQLRTPQPGIEREKLALFEASLESDILSAPLGRILPLAPLHELFASAWASASSQPVRKARAKPAPKSKADQQTEGELLAAIVRDPGDDAARLVYADLLLERGDLRGERIALSCKLDRSPEIDEAGRHRLQQLLEDPAVSGTSFLEQRSSKIMWDRGFVDGAQMKIPDFVRYAPRILQEHPLFRTLVIEIGLRRITDAQLDALAACESLTRIVELDFCDHYVHARPFARFLASPHLGRLRALRIGANPKGGGIGKTGTSAIAASAVLGELRELELPGQRVGDAGARILAGAANLAKLEVVRLTSNDLTDVGAVALLESPHLRQLRVLDLVDPFSADPLLGGRPNRFSEEVLARLAADPRVSDDA
ncbi:MAG: hypothetical protein K0S65_877, partial [Labilithrix sp.]|nr:hypothetical protein [Labilithrix sp.]